MQDPRNGALHRAALGGRRACRSTRSSVASCVETGELAALKSFSAGQHAFALMPKYRLRTLNDPKQSQIAGKTKIALMPKGENGSHATVGWMRFYGMTPQGAGQCHARRRHRQADGVVRRQGRWRVHRSRRCCSRTSARASASSRCSRIPRCAPLYAAYGDVELIGKQQSLALKKDVITPWFGEWNDVNGSAWQQAVLGKVTPEQAHEDIRRQVERPEEAGLNLELLPAAPCASAAIGDSSCMTASATTARRAARSSASATTSATPCCSCCRSRWCCSRSPCFRSSTRSTSAFTASS